MNAKIDWGHLFFSASGRTRPLPFCVGAGVLLLILALYESAVKGDLRWLTGLIVYGALIWSGVCVLSKRLHDRGRSGWWSAVILLAVVMVWPAPTGFFDFVAVLVLLWALVDLGLMPGERGDNRYGRTLYRLAARES